MAAVKDFIKQDLLKLPKLQSNGDFRATLFSTLDEFESQIHTVDIDKIFFDTKTEYSLIKNLIEGIKKSINQYLNGHPAGAYNTLKECLETNLIFSYISNNDLDAKSNLYRLRTHNENYALEHKELFHIPFDKRGKVATQRYSIPGFPCLYASNSVYVAWEELGRRPTEGIHAIRLRTLIPLKYLDLVTDVYTGQDKFISGKSDIELWNHLKAWPLIAACSIKVFDRKDFFKPEYIIPQLLLQIVRSEKSTISGIRFSSTHINLNQFRFDGEFYNFAIPVKSECDTGYCNDLINSFEMTDVVPWPLADVFTANDSGLTFSPPHLYSNISAIELIKGAPQGYMFTTFARLENMLNSLDLKPIVV